MSRKLLHGSLKKLWRKAIAGRDASYAIAAKEAQVLFDNAVQVVSHDYLTNKGIRPNGSCVWR